MATTTTYKPRDFDAEARGKTRCALVAAAMPDLLKAGTATLPEHLRRIDELVEYVFGDRGKNV